MCREYFLYKYFFFVLLIALKSSQISHDDHDGFVKKKQKSIDFTLKLDTVNVKKTLCSYTYSNTQKNYVTIVYNYINTEILLEYFDCSGNFFWTWGYSEIFFIGF